MLTWRDTLQDQSVVVPVGGSNLDTASLLDILASQPTVIQLSQGVDTARGPGQPDPPVSDLGQYGAGHDEDGCADRDADQGGGQGALAIGPTAAGPRTKPRQAM